MGIKIITDSASDLPREYAEQYQIEIVPLETSFGPEEKYLDGIDISPEQFWARLARATSLPKTSQPPPQKFAEVFRSALQQGAVLCINISSGLSGTFQSACLAKKMLGDPPSLHIIDSLSASIGAGLLALKAAQLVKEGVPFPQLVETITRCRDRLTTFCTLDTLENIVRGGRLSRLQGMVGSMLDIKLILKGNAEGKIEVFEKLRGRKKTLNRLVDLIRELGTDLQEKTVGISHLDCLEEVMEFKKAIIEKCAPKEVIIVPMGSTIGTYAAKGGIVVAF